MNWNETPAELCHFRAANACLQPLAVMESGVPIVDWCVIAPKRQFDEVVVFVTNDAALNLCIETGDGWSSGAGVRACRQTYFSEIAHLTRQRRIEVQNKLPFAKTAVG